jgi:hypothetical protein
MQYFKKIIFVVFAFLLLLHLSFTFIYNFDKVTTHPTIRFVVFKYMFPFFNQNNKIFAPDPPFCKQQLLVKYKKKNGDWGAFQNPQTEMLARHVSNRLSPIGTQIKHYDYILRNVYDAHIYADYYINNSKDSIDNNDSVKLNYLNKNDGFKMAQRYFSNLAHNANKGVQYDSLQFKVVYIYPEKYKALPLNKIKSTQLVINYPSLPILHKDESWKK